MDEKKGCLFEISWEVCNKVGGIYTVISSKAAYVKKIMPNYTLIGPYISSRASHEFSEEVVPEDLKPVFDELKKEGLPCRYGKWLIKSEPQVILIDFSNLYSEKNNVRKKFWDEFRVDSLDAPFDFDEPVIFSIAAAKLIDKIEKKQNKKIVAQFHEWMTGAGILWLKTQNPKVATIFTTHATVLGRAIVGLNPNFYNDLQNLNTEQIAKEHGVLAKHHIEKQSALNATVFTTVSEITGLEAEYILSRKPDVILPNGIDLENFASFEEISVQHQEIKHHIKDFVMSFFFPYYSFDLDDTLIYFIFGRYEYENKGIDIFIDALGKLNAELKKTESKKTIITFFFIPGAINGTNHDVLENKTVFADIKHYVESKQREIIDNTIYAVASQSRLTKEAIFSEEFLSNVKKKMLHLVKAGTPPYSTHDLKYFDSDAIINGFKHAGLNNHEVDRVKVIFYPTYLKAADGLLNLEVYEAIVGGHLGVFPSAYEPWGYTPLEAGALGVASVTTDLAGFGKYMEPQIRKENPGTFVLKRFGKSKEDAIEGLFQIIKLYASFDKEERIQNKIEARRIAGLADWKKLISNYEVAYNRAWLKFN